MPVLATKWSGPGPMGVPAPKPRGVYRISKYWNEYEPARYPVMTEDQKRIQDATVAILEKELGI